MDRPEFIRERKSIPFPYGMYQELLEREIDVENTIERQAYSYSFYREIDLVGAPPVMTIGWYIPEDYLYHLEGIRAFWEGVDPTVEPLQIMRFRLQQPVRNRAWALQNPSTAVNATDIPLELVTTPGRFQSSPTTGKRYMVRENVTYGPHSVIRLEILGHTGSEPVLLRVMTEGLRVPREVFTNQ